MRKTSGKQFANPLRGRVMKIVLGLILILGLPLAIFAMQTRTITKQHAAYVPMCLTNGGICIPVVFCKANGVTCDGQLGCLSGQQCANARLTSTSISRNGANILCFTNQYFNSYSGNVRGNPISAYLVFYKAQCGTNIPKWYFIFGIKRKYMTEGSWQKALNNGYGDQAYLPGDTNWHTVTSPTVTSKCSNGQGLWLYNGTTEYSVGATHC